MGIKYPVEVSEYIRKNIVGTTTRDMVAQLNEKFSEKYRRTFTEAQIKCYKANHKLQSGTRCGKAAGFSAKYGQEFLEYVQKNAEGRTNAELAEMVGQRFGVEFTARQMNTFKKNHSIVSGLDFRFQKGHEPANKGTRMSTEQYEKCAPTMFKKGNVPQNHMKVGEYTHTTDGYLIQKVKETGAQWERFEFVHRRVWEQHNGLIPDGKMVSFLDGDKDNCSIENLILIDNSINLEMNRNRLRFENPDLTKTGAAVAELKVAARSKRRRKNAF